VQVRCVAVGLLLFSSFSLFSSVCLLCVFVYAYVSFSVLWAQLPELNDIMIVVSTAILNIIDIQADQVFYIEILTERSTEVGSWRKELRELSSC